MGHLRKNRMKTDIGIWEIDRASRAATKLDLAKRVETEEMLEAVLVANPNMLMRGLTLVGRQIPVETGYVDLLGIDEDGRLVVFELKRDRLTRDVVAQILDYCTYLETLSDSELATLMAERSGKDGIKKIADFWEWYGNQPGDSVRPVRMVLVGLGIDVSAHRMVAYLAESGIDIRLLIFHGYVQGDGMLLARQVQTANEPSPLRRRARTPHALATYVERPASTEWRRCGGMRKCRWATVPEHPIRNPASGLCSSLHMPLYVVIGSSLHILLYIVFGGICVTLRMYPERRSGPVTARSAHFQGPGR